MMSLSVGRRLSHWWVDKMPFALVENPFELFISFLCCVVGIPYTFGVISQGAIETRLPTIVVQVWGGSLLVGGFLVTIGLLLRNRYIERAGLWLLSTSAFVYAMVVATEIGKPAAFTVAITIGFGVACISRLMLLTVAEYFIRRAQHRVDSE
jgi:hypothetical protein